MSAKSNVSLVTRIGSGVRLTSEATESIVSGLPDGFDYKARGAVAKAVIAWAVPAGEKVPAQKKGPAGEQVATDFGRGVDTLVKSVKRALAQNDDSEKEVTMRVTLSGEGGGSATIPADHPLYAALVALIAGGEAATAPLVAVAA